MNSYWHLSFDILGFALACNPSRLSNHVRSSFWVYAHLHKSLQGNANSVDFGQLIDQSQPLSISIFKPLSIHVHVKSLDSFHI